MKEHEALEFEKLLQAMDKRFRAQYDSPVYIVSRGSNQAKWIVSRRAVVVQPIITPVVILVDKRRKTAPSGVKGLKKTTNLYEFRILGGSLTIFSGENRNSFDTGPKRVEVMVSTTRGNWIGSYKHLLKRLGQLDQVRANLADPKLMEECNGKRP